MMMKREREVRYQYNIHSVRAGKCFMPEWTGHLLRAPIGGKVIAIRCAFLGDGGPILRPIPAMHLAPLLFCESALLSPCRLLGLCSRA